MSLPVTIVGGYLGSGKTTLINHLLRHGQEKKLAILVNEFGELAIDADLIQAQEGDLISLSGGCVCCSYGNDLISAIINVANRQPRPEHILLESSGVALPGAIAATLSLVDGVHLDGIVVLADAETVRQRATDKYLSDTVVRQLMDADIILLNKADLVAPEQYLATQKWLAELNPQAALLPSEQSVAPESVVLGVARQTPLSTYIPPIHAQLFVSWRIDVTVSVDPQAYAQQLLAEHPNIVRAKGFVRDLQGQLTTLQIVGKRVHISPATVQAACALIVICTKKPATSAG